MKTATAQLKSISPYSQSRHFTAESANNGRESHKDKEIRTWRERCNYDEKGQLFIPSMSFKNCLSEAAKYLGMQIAGKGKSTYTKHIEAGVMCIEPLSLPINKDEVEGEWLFVPASGRRGDAKRVDKCFPVIRRWSGAAEFIILDEIITEEVFLEHLTKAGQFIGIGRFRPRNNGYYGRFSVESLKWV